MAARRASARPAPGPRVARLGRLAPASFASALLLLAGIFAALSPPNTVDALTYHLPRQVRWLQQASVEHFAIHAPQMVVLPPMAEFAGLHLMVLSGGDFHSTLVQWFALLLAAVAASLIARELGGRPLAQAMAALLVVTNPMAWLQASSAKNDLVAAAWVVILAYWVLLVLRRGRCSAGHALLIGCAAGLALLTKPTGGLFALPFLLMLALYLLARQRARCIPAGILMAAAVLTINAGHFTRNIRMYDSPMPATALPYLGRPLTNETRSSAVLASSAVRNIALHLGTPWPGVNRRIESTILSLHGLIGVDLNDERTSAYELFSVSYHPRDESKAAAPVHVLLFGFAALALPLAVRPRRRHLTTSQRYIMARGDARRTAALLAATVAAFALFCLALKWQPWHARLHIGLLTLAAPATAAILCRGLGFGAIRLAAVLCLVLAPTVLFNHSRPLLGQRNIWSTPRDEMMRRYHSRESMEETVELVRRLRPAVVSLNLHHDGEYALMRRLLQLEHPPLFSQAMAPKGRLMPRPWPRPDLVISDVHDMPRFADTSTGAVIEFVHRIEDYRLYAPPDVAARLVELELIPASAGSPIRP